MVSVISPIEDFGDFSIFHEEPETAEHEKRGEVMESGASRRRFSPNFLQPRWRVNT